MFRLRIFETFTLADLVIIRDFVCRPEFHKRIAESGDSGFVYETVGSKTIKAFSNLSILAEIIIGGENEHARFACISKKVGMLLPLQELNPLKLNYEFKVYDLEEKKEKKFWLHQASDTAKILVLTLSDDDDS